MNLLRPVRPWFLALLIGLLVAAAALSFPVLGWLLLPGWVVSWPIFPEGVHTRSGAGLSWVVSIWIGAALVWSLVAYGVIKFVRHRRRQRESNAAA